MRVSVEELMQKKMQMAESEKGAKVELINEYIVNGLAYFKQRIEAMEDDRKADWQDLNRLFLNLASRSGEEHCVE